MLAAEFLSTADGREKAIETCSRPRLTEQVREFMRHRSVTEVGSDDCVLAAGAYLVGPSHHLMLRRVEQPVLVDRFPVTVGRYKRFLAAVRRYGSAQWDHPDMPEGMSHEPWLERLRIPGYYDDPRYDNYPAVAVNWWNA